MNIITMLLDSFSSVISAMGYGTKDKSRSFEFVARPRMSDISLELIYAKVPIARKIANLLPFYMLKEGIDFTNKDSAVYVETYKELRVFKHLLQALIYSRSKGGGACILLINDGQELDQPVNINNIKSIDGIITLCRSFLNPYPFYIPNMQPEFYQITNTLQIIHISRMLVFDGEDSGQHLRASNNGWGESIYNTDLWESIENYVVGKNCVNPMLLEKSQGIWKIEGLNDLVWSKRYDDIADRQRTTAMMMSLTNKATIDSKDDFIKVDTDLSNVREANQVNRESLVAETNIPHSLLFGESPGASLGEGGKSQMKDWYDWVKTNQENNLYDQVYYLNTLIAAWKKLKDKPTFVFNPLEQMSELDSATVKEKIANVDKIYKEDFGVSPEDIITSRFGDGKYSTNTIITKPLTTTQTVNNTGVQPDNNNNSVNLEKQTNK